MASNNNKAYRAYFLTSNNPQDHYEWAKGFDYTSATPAQFEELLQASIAPFTHGRNGTNRDAEKNGVIASFEVCEQGTPHIHHIICSVNPIRYTSLQRTYSHSDVRSVIGTVGEVTDYIYKRNRHADKNETLKCEPVTWGSYFIDNKGETDGWIGSSFVQSPK